MTGERDTETASAKSLNEPGHCLLLLRSPTDREVYEAFRTIAAHAKHGYKEHLTVEGDLSLTAGLAAPEIPATIERLLDADAEMIDRLEIEFGGLKWTYVRSGGHPPFRESFFDEIHIQQTDALSMSDAQLRDLFDRALGQLSVATHSGEGLLYDLVTEVLEQARRTELKPSAASDEKRV